MRYQALDNFRVRIVTCIMVLAIAALSLPDIAAQCVDHPSGTTAVKLNNQTKYDLFFGVDDEDEITVLSHKESSERRVEPGLHLLIAGAIVDGRFVWVWTENDVPKGQVCTWTIEDPQSADPPVKENYRSFLGRM